jgi:hypothetical protein
VLRANHIRSRCGATRSGNVFMVKLWVTVKREDYVAAEKLAAEYLKAHDKDTRYIHDAY